MITQDASLNPCAYPRPCTLCAASQASHTRHQAACIPDHVPCIPHLPAGGRQHEYRCLPVLPAVPSVMSPPFWRVPCAKASWMMCKATLSFTLPPGLRNSAFATICKTLRLPMANGAAGYQSALQRFWCISGSAICVGVYSIAKRSAH